MDHRKAGLLLSRIRLPPATRSCIMLSMCLAIPGKITSITGEDFTRMGKIDFGGVFKEASLAYVPEAEIGDYVIVHVGFAISRLDEAEAQQVFKYLRQMEDLSELGQEKRPDTVEPNDSGA